MTRPRRHSLAVELTPHCNQRCGYCYNDWRGDPGRQPSLSGEALLALVERAVTEVDFERVTLTGGEPFTRPELPALLALLARHGLRALVISNASMITDDHAAAVAPYAPLAVQVTLDGPDAALHEAHVGPGHFARTLRGVAALQRHGITVAGCVVVTRLNAARLGDTLRLWASLGVRDVALSRYSPAGWAAEQIAALLPSRSELAEALAQAEAVAAEGVLRLQVTMPVPPCAIDPADHPHLAFSHCPIGTEMQEFALGTDGALRHCTLHTATLGDARAEGFAALVTSPEVARYRDVTPAFCAGCSARARCVGGCGAAAATVTGDPRGLDPFVAQHVDDDLRAALARAREGHGFVPAGRLRARRITEELAP